MLSASFAVCDFGSVGHCEWCRVVGLVALVPVLVPPLLSVELLRELWVSLLGCSFVAVSLTFRFVGGGFLSDGRGFGGDGSVSTSLMMLWECLVSSQCSSVGACVTVGCDQGLLSS